MKKTLIIAAVAASLIALSGCQSQETKSAAAPAAKSAAQMSFETALASASAATKKANKAGNEWRDTGKIIKKAKAAAKKGDYKTANKLAKKAEQQSVIALQQAKEQKNAGNPSYLY